MGDAHHRIEDAGVGMVETSRNLFFLFKPKKYI
jgi:hypothetical protein